MMPQFEEAMIDSPADEVERMLELADDFLLDFSAPASAIRSLCKAEKAPSFPRLVRLEGCVSSHAANH
jgi:hypothetical protein